VQFGDNFRQLNSAVERLVSWQASIREATGRLIEQETATRGEMRNGIAPSLIGEHGVEFAECRIVRNIVGR